VSKPEIAQVSSGRSARLGAILVAGALVTVVWIGISGRPAPVVPASERPGLAQATTARPSATTDAQAAATPLPPVPPSPGPIVTPPPAAASIESDDLSIVATIGNRQFMTWLRPAGPGHLSGTLHVPVPPPATEGTVELEQVWRTVAQMWRTPSHEAWTTLGTWDLRLESLSPASGREYVVLDRTVPGRPTVRDVSQLVTRGYRITIRAQSGVPRSPMIVDVQIAGGHQLVGDDGLFGWPVVQIHAQAVPRTGLPYNVCPWDVGPASRRPRPSTDEANC
jgi:hypothetical protein